MLERESFEDEEVGRVLNKHFVAVKVDREERPDIDHIYMQVCQAMTGHGGWPLTVFLIPEKMPFYAGTYFPKNDRMGMPGLLALLHKVALVWDTDRESLIQSGEEIVELIRGAEASEEENIYTGPGIDEQLIHDAYHELKYTFNSTYGGFGTAPKFPTPHHLLFLLRYHYVYKENFALEMVEKTLDSMRRGGICDHIGFGFSRYSADRKWLVPHFEKMLYDNALLAIACLEAYQSARKEEYAQTARQIFTYVLRDIQSPEGGFYSAEDADSEGLEYSEPHKTRRRQHPACRCHAGKQKGVYRKMQEEAF